MQEMHNLLKNVKLVLIAEKAQRILMEKVNVGLAIIALQTHQNHYQQTQVIFLKVLVMKSRSHAVQVHFRMNMEQLTASIVQEERNAQINK